MVPPRGCAYVVMGHRQDASRGLISLKNARIHSNLVKVSNVPFVFSSGHDQSKMRCQFMSRLFIYSFVCLSICSIHIVSYTE